MCNTFCLLQTTRLQSVRIVYQELCTSNVRGGHLPTFAKCRLIKFLIFVKLINKYLYLTSVLIFCALLIHRVEHFVCLLIIAFFLSLHVLWTYSLVFVFLLLMFILLCIDYCLSYLLQIFLSFCSLSFVYKNDFYYFKKCCLLILKHSSNRKKLMER